jgi:CubicO group peptidase (beta-lactamase class C family)
MSSTRFPPLGAREWDPSSAYALRRIRRDDHRCGPVVVTSPMDRGLLESIAATNPRMRSLLVSVDGRPVVEHYFGTASSHECANIYSVTKSVLSLLIGIGIGRGEIRSVEQTLRQLLSETVFPSPVARTIRLLELLTMTAGLPPDPKDGGRILAVSATVGVRSVRSVF